VGPVKVHIPQPLVSYTQRRREVEGEGDTLGALLFDLDERFPGIRFRIVDEQDGIRPHVKFFVNKEQVRGLEVALGPSDEVHIFQALSGG
jgi:molybdopterin synthase sulfur carrier subunit